MGTSSQSLQASKLYPLRDANYRRGDSKGWTLSILLTEKKATCQTPNSYIPIILSQNIPPINVAYDKACPAIKAALNLGIYS